MNYYDILESNRRKFNENEKLKEAIEALKNAVSISCDMYNYLTDEIEHSFNRVIKKKYFVITLSNRVYEMVCAAITLIESIQYQSINCIIRVILEYTLIANILANSKNTISTKYYEWGFRNTKKIIDEYYDALNSVNQLTPHIKRIHKSINRTYNNFNAKYSLIKYNGRKIYDYHYGWTYFIDTVNPKVYKIAELYKRFIPTLYVFVARYNSYIHANSNIIINDSYDLYLDNKINLETLLKDSIILVAMCTHYSAINLSKIYNNRDIKKCLRKIEQIIIPTVDYLSKTH